MNSPKFKLGLAASFMTLAMSGPIIGQTANPAPAPSNEEVLVLSPFVVDASEDTGSYQATSTLAGTRVRTELRDVASPISVVTKQFLQDTGARNTQDLLVYTTNTDVGGVRGNFSGAGGSSTYNETNNLLRPQTNTRVRGLDQADNTRDYFLTEIPWDGYIVDRVDLQRGPNSILFGVGSPAGIINTSVNMASFKRAYTVENRVSSYGSLRTSLDLNHVLLNQELAFRIAALDDNTKYEQTPAFNHDRRVFGAVRYEPKWLDFAKGHTSIRANYERGDVRANRPRSLPPIDAITPWFQTGYMWGYANMNKMLIDPTTTWYVYGNNAAYPNSTYPWFREAFLGRLMSSNIAGFYDYNSSAPTKTMMPNVGTALGLNSSGGIDGTIGGIIFQRPWGISTYNKYARAVVPGGKYYSDLSLSDPTIYDFYNQLIDGQNKREWQKWNAANVAVSQTFFDNRVGFEFVYDRQRYKDGQIAFLNGDQYQISVDINTKLLDGTANPNAGRPYVANSGQYGNSQNYVNRDNLRFTATGELRATDFLKRDSLLARILGVNNFTALISQDKKQTDNRGFSRWASDLAFTDTTGGVSEITNGARQYDWIAYIGPSLASRSSASGAFLSNVTATIDPRGSTSVKYFDSHWAAVGVNPGDPYTYTLPDGTGGALADHTGTQADNPANYVGWTTKSFRILNADAGDIDQLWSSGTKALNRIKSKGVVWQGHLWDGAFVPVFGWRRDEVYNASSDAPKDANRVANMAYRVDTSDANTRKAVGESKSWGGVLHLPRFLKEKMPFASDLSVFYNRSENFKADAPRGDIFGNQIANPHGKTKDYGFVVSALDEKLALKVTWYETSVENATLGADSAGFSGSLYYVWAIPYWGATHALAAQDGITHPQPRQGDWGWPWNGIATLPDGTADEARIGAIVKDFFTNFPLDPHFVDEYGLGMNVAKMHSANIADWYAGVPRFTGAANLGLQPDYGGRLKSFGTGPVASVDTTSKGVEYEFVFRPSKNLNLSANASRTEASYSAISPTIDEWIDKYTKFLAGDAGLIRIWGGDTFRTTWTNQVLAPYSVLKAQIGGTAPEIPHWRFNLASTYSFSEGRLKGSWIGGAYRWEDRRILGYKYNSAKDVLNIDQPWYGPSDDHFDLWVGYSRRIMSKVDWRIQLNLRNVGENSHLVPVTMQPDGSVALSRIQEGMTWQITNTFTF